MRKLIVLIVILIIFLGLYSAAQEYLPQFRQYLTQGSSMSVLPTEQVKVVSEESVTIDAVKKVGPSVVTVTEESAPLSSDDQSYDIGPFSIFGQLPSDNSDGPTPTPSPQSIGSGFILTKDGLIVTNKHVVADVGGNYKVTTSDDKVYDVKKIYRDPLNDIAILQIDPTQNSGKTLQPVPLGDSSHLQVGQFVIAIGTALGQFPNTVTTGVLSGVGRGITAGSDLEGFVEQLDNVIQTSAAINPGNSGGPLLNSSGQVIGINTAVSESGQNIGFALPINVVKDSLSNFNQTGQFNRPYIGVAYKMISQDLAIANDLPQGAYIQDVVSGSPADKAGLKQGDIITKIDGQKMTGDNALSNFISRKKVGDSIDITYWRNGKSNDVSVTLVVSPGQ
ncbi:MAG TPA: trypsin-like peptidase domain-containing protein [Patescibacteria group bacterium]|nr:trypsin-like peptidase domain-containing protein [Patescibacteria group bacterium]